MHTECIVREGSKLVTRQSASEAPVDLPPEKALDKSGGVKMVKPKSKVSYLIATLTAAFPAAMLEITSPKEAAVLSGVLVIVPTLMGIETAIYALVIENQHIVREDRKREEERRIVEERIAHMEPDQRRKERQELRKRHEQPAEARERGLAITNWRRRSRMSRWFGDVFYGGGWLISLSPLVMAYRDPNASGKNILACAGWAVILMWIGLLYKRDAAMTEHERIQIFKGADTEEIQMISRRVGNLLLGFGLLIGLAPWAVVTAVPSNNPDLYLTLTLWTLLSIGFGWRSHAGLVKHRLG
jgi:hypothetical protein